MEIQVSQSTHVLSSLDFNAPGNRFTGFSGDGEISRKGDRVLWQVPAGGGSLRFSTSVDHLRGNVHDARMTEQWSVFRLDDLFPAARARGLTDTRAETSLTLSGPPGWRFETPYGPSRLPTHTILSDRLFPRPVGWAVGGDIGVRRDLIHDRQVAVAAPVGEGFRRQDTLAFLRWTLPTLISVFPEFPERLLIVGSAKDMWRGGLSAATSLYVHPDRPLISGNATSTLVHELVHVAVASSRGTRDDWLVEGLAEYYALEILRRAGGISEHRFEGAMIDLADWVDRDAGRLANPSTGADTAFAVLTLHELAGILDREGQSMDALTSRLLVRGLSSDGLEKSLNDLGVSATLPTLPERK